MPKHLPDESTTSTYIKHEFFSPIFSFAKKEYGATPKKEEKKRDI
jgi:hypothetical protein